MINKDGNIEVKCEACGKPITHTDKYGMWCDDECDRDEAIEMWKGLNSSLYDMGKKLGLDFF